MIVSPMEYKINCHFLVSLDTTFMLRGHRFNSWRHFNLIEGPVFFSVDNKETRRDILLKH